MANPYALLLLTPGTPERLPTDCPHCGWADLWQVALHTIGDTGVGTAGIFTRCQRCGNKPRTVND